ncbi:MAG: hypothetical protein KJZ53_06250 [Anaerolineales bacterium]|nr:hypothetical protein [Anaerolineales bacterium]
MENQNRRKWLLATVLALLGAATLCVWGAAAAGFRFSSPPLEAAIQAFNENRAQQPPNTGVGGDVNISVPGGGNGNGNGGDNGGGDGDGNGNGNGNGGGNGGGGGSGDSGCLLGFLCLDASVNTGGSTSSPAGGLNIDVDADTNRNGINVDADVNTGETERCFLGLLCINSNTDASLTPRVQVDSASAIQVNTQSINGLDVDAQVDANVDRAVNVDANVNTKVNSNNWLDNLLNLFVNVN